MTDAVIRSACYPGEYYDSASGCRLCTVVSNPYQQVLCPCEAFRDAVIGCKLISNFDNLCRQRSAALEECARRGFTSSVAPRTTSSAGSTAAPGTVSVVSATFTGEAAQRVSTTVTSTQVTGMATGSSDGASLLALGLAVGITTVMLSVVIGVIYLHLIRQRRKAFGHERRIVRRGRTDTDDQSEATESSKKLINADSVFIAIPQVPVHNGATHLSSQKPTSVVHNYHVTVKNSQFTQVGSHNVISVGEQVASAIASADALNSEDEEQVFCPGGSDASDGSSLSRRTSRDAAFSSLLYEQPEFVFHQAVPGDFVDRRDEDNACPDSCQNSSTSEMRSGSVAPRGHSAGFPDVEQRRSARASSGPADAGTTPHRNSVAGLVERREEISGSLYRGDENATTDSSHLPIEITDFTSQAMASPASRPAGCTDSSIVSKPLYSPPCDKECRTPSVSGQSAGDAVVPIAQPSFTLSDSRHVSLDCGGEKESLPLHSGALQSVSAGKSAVLANMSEIPTGEAVQNLDDDPNLPTSPTATLPPSSIIMELRQNIRV